jgi:transposase-like protein
MAKSGPRKTNRYSHEFKATAVRLSDLPDVLIQNVADALDIHPFMLSRWRKQAREGLIVTKGIKLAHQMPSGAGESISFVVHRMTRRRV